MLLCHDVRKVWIGGELPIPIQEKSEYLLGSGESSIRGQEDIDVGAF